MIANEVWLDVFINANILLCLAYGAWRFVSAALKLAGLQNTHATQLRLLNYVFLSVLLAPVIAVGFQSLQDAGLARDFNLNLTDRAVAYYLNGGFEMKSSDFQALIQSRDTFTLNLLSGSGWLAQGVIALFVTGVLVGLARLGYSVICLWTIVHRSFAWRRAGRVRVRISDRTLVPFSTRGLRNYYVVIPSHLLCDLPALKVSMAHEFQHVRHGDLEWEVLLEALKPIFILNPVYHIWKRQVEALRELTCDSQVLARGQIDVKVYCDTLLAVCQKTLRKDRSFVLAVPKVTLVTADRAGFLGSRSALEHRVLSMLQFRKLRFERLMFVALAVPLLALMVFATLGIQRSGDWSQDRLMLSTVVNLDRLDEINRLSTLGRLRN